MDMREIMKSLQSHFTPSTNQAISAFEQSLPRDTYQAFSLGEDPLTFVLLAEPKPADIRGLTFHIPERTVH
ncbi:hypothetical protein L486_03639 [Kwoniella mangroviensis CBS 10435]|uniref:Uncharacterized protein n=1 Tax=Kwoniella mangroviensis CBS 10435 TaxID=1331196 RepID=A0A1B9IUB8_9TREE|nr:hypothetical protein L486_03639 [Kwoniella mangroviensis CBS 10435]